MPAFNHHVLRAWHLDSSKTLEEVAYRAQVSFPHLRAIYDGRATNPGAALLARVADVYGRDIRDLFTSDTDPAGAR
jgi:transcriptional regulator with XRE-family HTH domain